MQQPFSYLPLRNHSAYSLLEGAISIDKLLNKAALMGVPALGLCDTSNLFGAMEFSLACVKQGIQPILGCTLRLAVTAVDEARPTAALPRVFPLPLFVQNEKGYRNLCALVTATTVGQDPTLLGQITWDQFQGKTDGLLALTGGAEGLINQCVAKGDLTQAEASLENLKALFPDRLYIELNRYGRPYEAQVESHLLALADRHHLPLLATNEAYFLEEKDYAAHDLLRCIAEGTYVDEVDRKRLTPHHSLKASDEMAHLFADVPEALLNTVTFAQRCSFVLSPRTPLLPNFGSDRPEPEELRAQAHAGLAKRLKDEKDPLKRRDYEDRLVYELNMIIQMGFSGYFLIVADFIQWAKNHHIPVGPGRGSGASSLVAWALTITDVDPVRFGLLFERFLNPERVSMPDFDVDFCQERRDEVIRYTQDKYGADRVAHIITFGKLQARAVLRDVGRVLQMSYNQVDGICKRIPNNPAHPVTLDEAIAQDAELRSLAVQDPQVGQLLNFGKQLEGLYRHASTHAAGVVIADRPLVDLVPLYQDPHSPLPATQFSMKYVEMAGLVKFDFLGLKTLTVLQKTIHFLKKRQIDIDILAIPLDDPETFALLRRVETVAVFQVESGGMTDVLRKLAPEAFEELIALVALYRPGPMDDIPRYLACRHGHEKVTYPYTCLEGILKETFGVMVYQEQVLQIARVLAGYSLGSADMLRRAMGKKIQSEMDAQRKTFVEGVITHHGGSIETAATLFDQIAKFAGYAFPKAHAAPYALITYQTAYLKANYPVEFMTATLVVDAQNTDKLATLAREVRRMGIALLRPDINLSGALFEVESLTPDEADSAPPRLGIRYGLAALKNVGLAAMEAVIAERHAQGPFTCIYDFFERMIGSKALNKRQMEALIGAGAFDALNPNRQQLMLSLETLLKYGGDKPARISLFDISQTRPPLVTTPDFPPLERLRYEFSAIGFYLSDHPLDIYGEALKSLGVLPSNQILERAETGTRGTFPLAGVLITKTEKTSKAGQKYAFLQLSDAYGVFEVTLFSEILAHNRAILGTGQPFLVDVSARVDGETVRLLVQSIRLLDPVLAAMTAEIMLDIATEDTLERLVPLLQKAPSGSTIVRLRIHTRVHNRRCLVHTHLPEKIAITGDLRAMLQSIEGINLQEKASGSSLNVPPWPVKG